MEFGGGRDKLMWHWEKLDRKRVRKSTRLECRAKNAGRTLSGFRKGQKSRTKGVKTER